MAMTLVLPGSAQVACGNRRVGLAALRIWFALLMVGAGCLVVAAVHHEFAFWLVSDLARPADGADRADGAGDRLGRCSSSTRGGSVSRCRCGWATAGRRSASTAILCFSVASVLLFGAHLVGVQRDFIQTMFGSGDATGAHDGRYNVLLLGGDSGVDRWGLRPDSITLASIDAETGRTVLVSLPRNMQNFPFAKGSVMHEQFPQGFDCEHCMLNGVNTWAHGQQGAVREGQGPRHRRDHLGGRGHHRPEDELLGDGEPQGVPRPGGRRRRRHPQRPVADPDRRPRLRRLRLHRARQAEAHRLPDPVVRPGPRRAPTTTRGWRGRSA